MRSKNLSNMCEMTLQESQGNVKGKSMSNLKISVSFGSFNVELDGPSEEVIKQFEEIKKNGLGEMIDQLVPMVQYTTQPNNKTKFGDSISKKQLDAVNSVEITDISRLSLQDIAINELPVSEPEWIVVYGYFASLTSGNSSFTREELIDQYEASNRKTDIRLKNLSHSIKSAVKKGWVSKLNDTNFVLKSKGKDQLKVIIERK